MLPSRQPFPARPITTVSSTGTARRRASSTGECSSAHRTMSWRAVSSVSLAAMRTTVRRARGPAGVSSPTPSRPRSSQSLSTSTSSRFRLTPFSAARIAMREARQAALAERSIHPGVGAEPFPPTPAPMSVTKDQPWGPPTRTGAHLPGRRWPLSRGSGPSRGFRSSTAETC